MNASSESGLWALTISKGFCWGIPGRTCSVSHAAISETRKSWPPDRGWTGGFSAAGRRIRRRMRYRPMRVTYHRLLALVNGLEKFWNSRFGFVIIETIWTMKMVLKSPYAVRKIRRTEVKESMKQPRKKIVLGVMLPVVMAIIVLKRIMGMPTMNGISMVNVEALLVTGMLIGIAVAQGITAFRKTN
jgi:hypothetical protein